MSSIKEKIKAEIERLENYYTSVEWYVEALLSFIDSLPDENNPEPYNPVYDEDYLNEKIAKATKSWEGVDVDKMLAKCRGYEEKPSEELEEAAARYERENRQSILSSVDIVDAFIAGAEWHEQQMMEEAVVSEIGITSGGILLRDLRIEDFDYEDRAKIIIVKQDDRPRD